MNALKAGPRARIVLQAETAADLMTPNPLSVRQDASIQEAVAFLTDKGFSAAPVIDAAGQPVGVLSQADIVVHDREKADFLTPVPEFYHRSDLTTEAGEMLPKGFQVQKVDRTQVKDIMTPVVFAIAPDSPAKKAVDEMLDLKVHRLFVVDRNGVLVGVISALDVLKQLRLEIS